MLQLRSVYTVPEAPKLLYRLLGEREPWMSISHKQMPTWSQHEAFIASNPYSCWYVCEVDGDLVGAAYLTRHREVGIGILKQHQRKGYARQALQAIMAAHPGDILANVNPDNAPSRALFKGLGGEVIQLTYRVPA